ncbi:MAG: PAS domain-containing sensor histidine kinase [Gemmatimonadaceae bacterium]
MKSANDDAAVNAKSDLLALVTQERTRLEAVLQQMPGGVVVVDAQSGRVLLMNAEAERLARPPADSSASAGIPADALIEHGAHLLRPDEWPLTRALRTGQITTNQEMQYLRDDGSLGTVLVSAAPIRNGDRTEAAVAIFNDVTEQRATAARLDETQEKLLALFNSNVIGLAWGENEMISEANDQLLRTLGCTRDDLPLDWNRMTPPDQRWINDRALREGLNTGRFTPFERDFIRKDTSLVPVVIGGYMLGTDPFRYVAFVLDITSQKMVEREQLRLAEELRVANLEAERARVDADRANAAKSEFLSTMSHEIRTPLNAIIGYVQLLEMGIGGVGTDAQRLYLERLRSSSGHLLLLVNEVLDLAKAESSSLVLQQQTGSSDTVIEAAIVLVAPLATARGITLDHPSYYSASSNVQDLYLGDEDRVRQILVNMLGNAVKFTPRGGAVIIESGTVRNPHVDDSSVRTQTVREGSWATITVTDTGIGIPSSRLVAIFEPFVQLEATRDVEPAAVSTEVITATERGTGLGLAISRRLARAMGGDLTVRSVEHHGSSFTLWLPVPTS